MQAIKIFNTETEYTLKAIYNKTKIPDIPYPSLSAMQTVIDPFVEADPKLSKIDARNYISDRFLKKLEEEGFVKKLMGR